MKKKDKKRKPEAEAEPQYYMSATNIPAYNYNVYRMSKKEKILYFLAAFAAGGLLGYLFFGGIGKDDLGEPTLITYILDTVIVLGVGFFTGKKFIPVRTQQLVDKNRKNLRLQFRDMLESLNTSFGSGKNVMDSFLAVYEDLKIQYDEGSHILNELEIINSGIQNNISIEELLENFGERSGIEDIKSFANVFRISYRKGGNIKDTIRSTYQILNDKMVVEDDIETVVTSSKTELKIMMVLPVMIIAMMKFMSPEFASNFVTVPGIIATVIGIVLFLASYKLGKVILDIKV